MFTHKNTAILFVDDNENFLHGIRRQLGPNYDITLATSAFEAIALIENKEYAVIVSDLKMPGMDGNEFFSVVKKRHMETVRVLLTAYANFQNAADAINEGNVFRFLSKPVQIDLLKKTLNDSLEQYNLLKIRAEMQALQVVTREMESMILALSKVVEIRDPYTAGHQARVAQMTELVARELDWSPHRTMGLKLASTVHDIGKLYVPSEFLNKPGMLSTIEFSVIKKHPLIGFDILDAINFQWPISTIVVQHHERLDGSGYPYGLAGNDICDEAQIISICDIFDAMCNHRPYRPGFGKEKAIDQILSMKTVQIRENLVSAFERVAYSGQLETVQ